MLFERHAEFAEAVKKSKGKVVVLVHPFFARRQGYVNHQHPGVVNEGAYEDSLKKLVAGAKAPVVVLEEDEIIHRHRQPPIAPTHVEIGNNNTYFVKTLPTAPTPIAGWEPFHELFQRAGVKTVLVAGTLAVSFTTPEVEIHAPAIHRYEQGFNRPPTKSIAWGCVGVMYETFIKAKYAKVRVLPTAVFPHAPCYGKHPKLTLWQKLKMQRLLKKKK